jgi:hypothetical protein
MWQYDNLINVLYLIKKILYKYYIKLLIAHIILFIFISEIIKIIYANKIINILSELYIYDEYNNFYTLCEEVI